MNVIGKQIGNHLLVELINNGTYGSVYRANHAKLSELVVAVKLLRGYLDLDPVQARDMFLKEARMLAVLKHRHILPVHDVGFSNELELPYIVVEYAPGGSLRDRLKKRAGNPFFSEEALVVLTQVGQALEYAHQHDVVHRDLKPENILFNEYGEALLCDFGLATVLQSSMRQTTSYGTPTYMAPEQSDGIVSKEGDQYALGCIAYELFTGHKVFDAPSQVIMAVQHATKAPTPPTHYNKQLPDYIEQAILRALAKNRMERYPSITTFLDALKNTSNDGGSARSTLGTDIGTGGGDSIGSLLSDGDAHLRLKRPKDALAAFELVLKFAPTTIAALLGKGRALSALERYEEALQVFDRVVHLEPGKLAHRKELEEVRVQLKKKAGRPSAALELYNQGNAFYEQKQYEQALIAFAEAARLEPSSAHYHSGRAHTLYTLKRYEDALVVAKEAARLMPKVPLYARMQGESLYALKRYQDALQAFEKAAQLEPKVAYYHEMQAESLCKLNRYADALQAYERAAQLDPSTTSYRERIKEIKAQLKREEDARTQNKPKEEVASPNKDKEQAAALHKQGTTFNTAKQYEKALEAFTGAVRLQPENAGYQSVQGRTFHLLKRYDEALAAFQEAARLDTKSGYYYRMQGDALYELKRYQDALQAYERAAQLDPAATSYRKKITEIKAQLKSEEEARKAKEQAASFYKQGTTFLAAKQYEKALTALTEAARLQPDTDYRKIVEEVRTQLKREEEARVQNQAKGEAASFYKQGTTFFTAKQYEKALQAFDRAAKLDPSATSYRKRVEETRAQLKREEETRKAQLKREEEARVQNQAKEKAASLYKQGNTFFVATQYEKALTALTEAVRLQPGNADYQNARGRILHALKHYEQAVKPFKEAVRLAPEVYEYSRWLGEAFYELKQYQEALQGFASAVQLEPRIGYYHKMQGECRYKLKRYAEALQAFEIAAQLEPNDPSHRARIQEIRSQLKREEEAHNQNQAKEKAAFLYKQGKTFTSAQQHEKALVAYWEAVNLQPGNPHYLSALGRTFDILQRCEEALAAFRNAASLLPKDSTPLQMQAEILWKLRRYQDALAMYEQAISLEPRKAYHDRLAELRTQFNQQETGLQRLLKNLFR